MKGQQRTKEYSKKDANQRISPYPGRKQRLFRWSRHGSAFSKATTERVLPLGDLQPNYHIAMCSQPAPMAPCPLLLCVLIFWCFLFLKCDFTDGSLWGCVHRCDLLYSCAYTLLQVLLLMTNCLSFLFDLCLRYTNHVPDFCCSPAHLTQISEGQAPSDENCPLKETSSQGHHIFWIEASGRGSIFEEHAADVEINSHFHANDIIIFWVN